MLLGYYDMLKPIVVRVSDKDEAIQVNIAIPFSQRQNDGRNTLQYGPRFIT